MPEEGIELTERSHLMSIEEIIDIARVFVDLGVKKIRLTGGEPLIRKNIEKLLTEISAMGVELAITTNGILLDKFVDTFKKVGLKNINISLDTLDKEKSIFITKRDYFDRILQNIDLMIENNFNVKINVVAMQDVNVNEILDFIEWTKHKPLTVKFIEFMPFKDNKWDWSKGVSFAEIIEKAKLNFGKNLVKVPDSNNDTTRHYQIKGYKGKFGVISSVTNPFCSTCNRMRLTANGRMKNCLFSNKETDLLTSMRNGDDIKPLILESILQKKKERAGMDSFAKFSDESLNSDNRAMTAIGG